MSLAILPALLLQVASGDSTALRHANGLVPPTVTAVRIDRAPTIDGRLDEPVWALAAPVTQFLQTDPEEGKPVSEATEVRVLYDAEAIYVGARLFDREPQRIIRRLGRRDAQPPSDDFRVLLDSYHDHRTAFRFTLNPAGVLFSSNPRGDNQEGWSGGRYGAYYDLERWRELVSTAGFTEVRHYYRPPGLPRARQPWLASLWRKS